MNIPQTSLVVSNVGHQYQRVPESLANKIQSKNCTTKINVVIFFYFKSQVWSILTVTLGLQGILEAWNGQELSLSHNFEQHFFFLNNLKLNCRESGLSIYPKQKKTKKFNVQKVYIWHKLNSWMLSQVSKMFHSSHKEKIEKLDT